MKEQMEEIAKTLCRHYNTRHCEVCDHHGRCMVRLDAECIYNADYRKQEWISVDERLPENDYGKHWKERRYYLVMTEPCGLMRVARFGYKDFPWWIDSHDTVLTSANYNKVTHWMPLPDAPKMKGGAE